MKRKIKEKVLVAMSGGVDSSVAAALLVKKGYDVTGAFMVNYDEDPSAPSGHLPLLRGENNKEGQRGVCWRNDYQDALRVAAKLGIKLLRLDFTKEYKKMVLDYMYSEYEFGRTPNPDVLCNKYVKFGAWLEKAQKLGFDYLATGHYARLRRKILNPKSQTHYSLLTSKDSNKDQTYFLHQLNQKQLSQTMFPIGNYTKSEVRVLAREFNLPTAEKEESMGICFVGEVNMKDFLQKKIKIKKGDIILHFNRCRDRSRPAPTKVIGHHDGLPFYTIGQRIGLFCQDDKNKPLYILDKNMVKNQLIVGHENDPLLYKKETAVKDVNWMAGRWPNFPLKCKVRLRHRQPLQDCIVVEAGHVLPTGRDLSVRFNNPQRAVTPGQFAVFYKGTECLGGGVIK